MVQQACADPNPMPRSASAWQLGAVSSDTPNVGIPQKPEGGRSRLKRVVMIGDHHQLPPVVKNQAFQKYAHLDQSLFTRFVRLGTPYLELNAQVMQMPSHPTSPVVVPGCYID